MATMQEIETAAKEYAKARAQLEASVQSLEDERRLLVNRRLPGIRARVGEARVAREALHVLVKTSPELFEKPRTALFHGIKVGFEKGKGKVVIADVAKFVTRVREHLKAKFDVLVKTTYKPVKKAVQNLPADELKKLGVTIEGTGDQVVIEDPASDVDKLVEALLGKTGEGEEAGE